MILLTQVGGGGHPDELLLANPHAVETVMTTRDGTSTEVRFVSGRILLVEEDRDELAAEHETYDGLKRHTPRLRDETR